MTRARTPALGGSNPPCPREEQPRIPALGGSMKGGATGAQVPFHNSIIDNFRKAGERGNDGLLPLLF